MLEIAVLCCCEFACHFQLILPTFSIQFSLILSVSYCFSFSGNFYFYYFYIHSHVSVVVFVDIIIIIIIEGKKMMYFSCGKLTYANECGKMRGTH